MTRRRRLVTKGLVAGGIALTLALTGCSTTGPTQTRFMREQTELEISAEELRIRVRALAMPLSGMMEEGADALLETSDDPDTRIAALRWKINGIPAVQSALFNPDPLAALMDAWTLMAQMRLFFDRGAGTDLPENQMRNALETIDRMEREIEALVREISRPGGFERGRDTVYRWAEDNPIDLHITSRRSTAAELAAFTAEASPGIRKAVGGLSLGLGDVWARLDTYAAWMPKQARWQAELLVDRVLAGEDAGGALSDFTRLTDAIGDIAVTVQGAPDLVSSEREALLEALQEERVAALETLNREFLAAVDTILEERIRTAEEVIGRERQAVLEALAAERVAVLEALHRERVATIEDLDRVLGGLAEDSMRRVVDHAFVRLLQLVAIIAVLIGFGAALLGRFVRRG
jgi:hypothetical protein